MRTARSNAPRAQAYLSAFRLIEAGQPGHRGDEIRDLLRTAERRGWSDVARVLLYADAARAWEAAEPTLNETIGRLRQRSEDDAPT